MMRFLSSLLLIFLIVATLSAQTVTIDTSTGGRRQVIDGFGTCLSGTVAMQTWFQQTYFDEMRATIVRMDLVPNFKSPWRDYAYVSPWYSNSPPLKIDDPSNLGGPEHNNVRTYTGPSDYTRLFGGHQAKIAVMGPDINVNVAYFDFLSGPPLAAGTLLQAGKTRSDRLGQLRLIGSVWSPPPWLKISSGNTISGQSFPLPLNGTAYPFVWGGNFAGGKLDVSGSTRVEFDDSSLGGTGPTSALTQYARYLAAYLRGMQNTYGVQFYSISLQNEVNFEEFYNSATYPLASQYIAILKVARAELNKYSDLAGIRIMGPEDLLNDNTWGLWQFGGGATTTHKNLQYLSAIAADPVAASALDFFCIHGYATDGVTASGSDPLAWSRWYQGWTTPPALGLPANVSGFSFFNKRSWLTETSGEANAWISPATGFPNAGGFSIALKMHQALVTGNQSAWLYWQFSDANPVSASSLVDPSYTGQTTSYPKYHAARHFFRYIRPDAVRVNTTVSGSTTLLASSFLHDSEKTLVTVLINTGTLPQTATITIPGTPFGIQSLQTFTSQDSLYWQSGTSSITAGQSSITVPAYGVVTVRGVGLGGGETFNEWIANYFSVGANRNTSANPGGDSVSNLVKFACNLDPRIATAKLFSVGGTSGLPVSQISGNRLTVTFLRRHNAGLTYSVESSSDLKTWTTDYIVSGSPTVIDDTWDYVTYASPRTYSASTKEFARVRIVSQ